MTTACEFLSLPRLTHSIENFEYLLVGVFHAVCPVNTCLSLRIEVIRVIAGMMLRGHLLLPSRYIVVEEFPPFLAASVAVTRGVK